MNDEFILKCNNLGLVTYKFNLNDPICLRLSSYQRNDDWMPIDMLGLQLGQVLFLDEVIVFGTTKILSSFKLDFIKSSIEPYIKLFKVNKDSSKILHDIRTPLACIKHQISNEDIINKSLNFIVEYSEKILEQKIDKDDFNLIELVLNIISIYNCNKKIVFNHNQETLMMKNKSDFYRIINNLISNACKGDDIIIDFYNDYNNWELIIRNKFKNYLSLGYGLGTSIVKELTIKNNLSFNTRIEGDTWISKLSSTI